MLFEPQIREALTEPKSSPDKIKVKSHDRKRHSRQWEETHKALGYPGCRE